MEWQQFSWSEEELGNDVSWIPKPKIITAILSSPRFRLNDMFVFQEISTDNNNFAAGCESLSFLHKRERFLLL